MLYWFSWRWRSEARLKWRVIVGSGCGIAGSWKIGIQVVRGLGGVVEVVDALEVLQKKVNLAGKTTKSAVKNASG